MPKFLFKYHELFSVLGNGTPENPGGDFGMYCWIEAPDADAALEWGYVLLGDYYKQRFAQTPEADHYDGAPLREGEIETDQEFLDELVNKYKIPECQVGTIPDWNEPWRMSNLERK